MNLPSFACPSCRAPMAVQCLAAAHSGDIEIDHCRACRLIWFDPLEFSVLSRESWVRLLRMLAISPRDAPVPLGRLPLSSLSLRSAEGACPGCSQPLVVHAQHTQFGRYTSHACPEGHAHAQRDAALLSSRGLFRPLLLAERVALATQRLRLACSCCGTALDGDAESCSFCHSAATVLDVPRLSVARGLTAAAA